MKQFKCKIFKILASYKHNNSRSLSKYSQNILNYEYDQQTHNIQKLLNNEQINKRTPKARKTVDIRQ